VPEPSSEAAAMMIGAHRNVITAELNGTNSVLDAFLTNSRHMAEYGSYTPGDAAIEIDVLERAVDEGSQTLKDTIRRHRGASA